MIQSIGYQAIGAWLLLVGAALSTAAHANEAAERATRLSQKLSVQGSSPSGSTPSLAVLQTALGKQVSGLAGTASTHSGDKK